MDGLVKGVSWRGRVLRGSQTQCVAFKVSCKAGCVRGVWRERLTLRSSNVQHKNQDAHFLTLIRSVVFVLLFLQEI